MARGLREEKKQQTRERIRRCAVELFVARGFDAVAVADVAAAAEVSVMTVFNHYPAKEDLFLDGAATAVPDFVGAVAGARTERDVVDAVRSAVLAGVAARAEWTGLHDGGDDYARVVEGSEQLMRAVQRSWSRERERFAAAVAARIGRGGPHSPSRLAARVLATQLVATVEGLTTVNHALAVTPGGAAAVRSARGLADDAFARLTPGGPR